MFMLHQLFLFLALAFANCLPKVSQNSDGQFQLAVVHFNDFHARFEETSWQSTTCESEDHCIGGISRLFAAIKRLKKERPDTIVLNGGDNFQGTIYYNLFKWNITQYFLNMMPIDATVLGNHEFDDKVAGVVPFLKNLKSPVIVANLDDSLEPDLQGLYKKSIVVEINGKKIGLIGVLTSETKHMSSSEKLIFLDESESINAEAERLVKEEGVFTNIVLSHCGYDVEQKLAANATGKISLIVGAHSHTFLYTGEPTPGPDKARGPYPTEIQRPDGKSVLVIQASAYAKYIGDLKVNYDENGDYVSWSGKPIFLDNDAPQDLVINAKLKPWKVEADKKGKVVIGEALVTLDRDNCRVSECLLGDFLADAALDYYQDLPDAPQISVTNPGGLRTSLVKGNITYADLLLAQPFQNTIDVGNIQGKYVKQMLELSATPYYHSGRLYTSISTLQMSGIRVVYDLSQPIGERAVSIKVLSKDYTKGEYEDLDLHKMYTITLVSFLRNGGDGYNMFKENLQNVIVGDLDVDVFTKYIKKKSPIYQELDGRIKVVTPRNMVLQHMTPI